MLDLAELYMRIKQAGPEGIRKSKLIPTKEKTGYTKGTEVILANLETHGYRLAEDDNGRIYAMEELNGNC